MAADGNRRTLIAIVGTIVVHALFVIGARLAPEPVREAKKPEPRKPIAARVVPPALKPPPPRVAPRPPEPKPAPAPEPKPAPPPAPKPAEPVAAPKPAEPVAAPKPAEPPPTGAAAPAPAEAQPPAKPPKRSGGRTLAAKNARPGAPTTTAPNGKGRVADFGDYDPNAGAGSEAPPPPSAPPADRPSNREPEPGPATTPAPAPEPKKPAAKKLVPPVPKSRPTGRYPAGVPKSPEPVRVVLSLSVAADGSVTAVRVVSGQSPELDAEAKRLAASIEFEPARRGDDAVAMTIPWTVTFK